MNDTETPARTPNTENPPTGSANCSLRVECPTCRGNGRVEMLEHCPTCKGFGVVIPLKMLSDWLTEQSRIAGREAIAAKTEFKEAFADGKISELHYLMATLKQ